MKDAGSGWKIGWQPGKGLGLKYTGPWPQVTTSSADFPSCNYTLGGAKLRYVRTEEHPDNPYLIGATKDDEHAWMPLQLGAGCYANDSTVEILRSGRWQKIKGAKPTAEHHHIGEGLIQLRLTEDYKLGEWVSVEYGERYWNSACADAIEAQEVATERRTDPDFELGGSGR